MLPNTNVPQGGGLSALSLCSPQTLIIKDTGRPFPSIHCKGQAKPSGRTVRSVGCTSLYPCLRWSALISTFQIKHTHIHQLQRKKKFLVGFSHKGQRTAGSLLGKGKVGAELNIGLVRSP